MIPKIYHINYQISDSDPDFSRNFLISLNFPQKKQPTMCITQIKHIPHSINNAEQESYWKHYRKKKKKMLVIDIFFFSNFAFFPFKNMFQYFIQVQSEACKCFHWDKCKVLLFSTQL